MSLNIGVRALRRAGEVVCFASLCSASLAWANDLHVPSQYKTIQGAVNAAAPGDTVYIAKGLYKGFGNVDIDTHGKAIKIQGSGYLSTIIDCAKGSRAFIFQNNETSSTEVRALTIQNGKDQYGGAILVSGASPAILYCSFNDCVAEYGGAVAIQAGNPGFVGCQFVHNHASQGGGGVFAYNSASTLMANTFDGNQTEGMGGAVAMQQGSLFVNACIFKDNVGDQGGGAFFSDGGDVALVNGSFSVNTANTGGGAVNLTDGSTGSLTNCTFGANLSHNGAGALQTDDKSHATVANTIMWTDGSREYFGNVNVRFSCISGGAPGDGNTADDPKLLDAIDHNLHIRIGSSCIDKADQSSIVTGQDQDGRARTIGAAPDMGAYEFPIVRPTPEVAASVDNTFQVPHDGNPRTDTVLATVHGSAFDWLNGTVSYLWTCDDKVLGDTPNLSINLEPGEQVFKLQVRDDTGGLATQDVHVKVLPEQNSAPTANAGPDQNLICRGGTVHVTLHGNGYDADGDPLSYSWNPINETTQDVELDLGPGNYYYTLTVTDPYGATGRSTVAIHVADGLGPKVVLNGDNPMYQEVFDPFLDPGATATDEYDGANLVVKIYGFVDNTKLGTYTLTYAATDSSGNTGSATRQVIVRDTKAPVITLNGDNPMSVDCSKGYTEPGATAIDNYDGPVPVQISGAVATAPGTYSVTYTASDSSGNVATAIRTVVVSDVSGPVIVLNGANPMTLECSQGYVEPGATATDGCVGAELPVSISGTVTSTPGTYTVSYTATDASGLTATVTRTVNVTDTKAPDITLNGANPMTVECGTGYTEPGATATDACDGSNVPVTITGSVPNKLGTYTITYTATDKAGNKATVTRTVTVEDTQAPVITLNGANPMSIECGTGYTEPGATATDGCDGASIPVTITGTVNSAKGTYTITYTAQDSAGNKATVTRTVKVVDTTPPVITLTGLPTITLECGQGYTEYGAIATDTCDGPVSVNISGTVTSSNGTYTVTYTATDSSGNSATATRTVIVSDSTAPVITLNGANPMTIECGNGYVEPGASAVDSCDTGPITVTISGTVLTSKGTYTVTYTAKDSSGNTATATRTVNVVDTIAPVITLKGSNPMTIECAAGYTEPGATATDVCDGTVNVVITGTVSTGKGSYVVTYTATDSSGNMATKTRAVSVVDTTAPLITLNGANPMTVECGSGYVEPGATATDGCDGASVPVTISGTVLTSKGTYTITYKATDNAGNTATKTRTVNVTDTKAPAITLSGANPMTVECGSGYSEPGATAADACDGTVTVAITGTVLTSKGTYTVTYKATDSSGNSATVTRTVNVTDTKPPVITLNGSNPMTVECGSGYAEPGATATDVCDGSVAVTITGTVLTSKGTYTVTYKATDSSGNSATATRTVNVVDTTPPVITLKGSNPMTVQCGAGYSEPGATAVDACDGSVTVSITGTVSSAKGTYTVTYTATDSSGNSSTKTRTVNVVDTTPPTITLNGSNPMTVECGSGYTEPGATATDGCDGTLAVTITGSVVTSTVGTYTVTYTATDSSGNTVTATRTVNVVDTTPPVITLSGSNPMTVDCTKGYTEPGATAVDACDGSVAVTITGTVPSTAGTYTVTYTATDSHGNTATVTRTVYVVAKTPPSANNFNATPSGLKGGKTTNVNLHYGFDQHCAAYSWDVECTASGPAGSVITKIDNNNFTIKAVSGCTYTFALTVTDIDGNTATYTIQVIAT